MIQIYYILFDEFVKKIILNDYFCPAKIYIKLKKDRGTDFIVYVDCIKVESWKFSK